MGGPITSTSQRTLRKPTHGPDVAFLHALLNYHLGPPDDQLPLAGPEANLFGARTEAKVKKFQQVNKIDIGTKDFMDGVAGPHTWAKLTERQQVTVTVVPTPPHFTFSPEYQAEQYLRRHPGPQLHFTPPTLSNYKPPSNGLVLDSFQLQAGGQGTLPLYGGGGPGGALSLQIGAIVLNRTYKQGFHHEFQFGMLYNENYGGKYGNGPGDDSKRDLGFFFSVTQANMPGLGGRWSWGFQEQLALNKSLYNGSGSLQASGNAVLNLSLIKRNDNDVLQLTGQTGPILELDPPGETNDHRWGYKVGWGAFLGLTVTYTRH